MSWYTEGKINVINGNTTVQGVGTNWDHIHFADIIMIDFRLYEVKSVASATQLELRVPYAGASRFNLDYSIMRNLTNSNNYDLLVEIEKFVNDRQVQLDEFAAWANGPAGGGPASDGKYPITDRFGVVHMIYSPLQMQATTGTVPDMSAAVAVLQGKVTDLEAEFDAFTPGIQRINGEPAGVSGNIIITPSDVGAQPASTMLSSLAAQAWVTNKLAYSMGTSTMALTNLTALGRAIIGCADASQLAAVLAIAVVTEAPMDDKAYFRRMGMWQENTMGEAPQDNRFYSRQNARWVVNPAFEQYYDILGYWPETELGPDNTLLKQYPRQFLTSPIFSESLIRRDVVGATTVTFSINSTTGGWNCKGVIPAGEQQGYFLDYKSDFLGAGDGVTIRPDELPMAPIQGLNISLRFKVRGDATTAPTPVPTDPDTWNIFMTGAPKLNKASIDMLDADNFEHTVSVNRNFVVNQRGAMQVSPDGKWIAMVNGNGTQLMIVDSRTKETVRTVSGTFSQAVAWRPDSIALLVHQSGNLILYNLANWTPITTTPTSSYGLGTINTIRYSANGRLVAIAHTNGVNVVDSSQPAWTLKNWLGLDTGVNVIDAQFDSGVFLLATMTATTLKAVIVSNGIAMPTTRYNESITNMNHMAWNEAADTNSIYPFFIISGVVNGENCVLAFHGDDYGLKQVPDWKVVVPTTIRDLVVAPISNIRGRQFAVAHDVVAGNILDIHEYLSAEQVATVASLELDGIRGMNWLKIPGAVSA